MLLMRDSISTQRLDNLYINSTLLEDRKNMWKDWNDLYTEQSMKNKDGRPAPLRQ